MTVGLTNCQHQGVYNIHSYKVCWGLRAGVGSGGGVGLGALYVIQTHS